LRQNPYRLQPREDPMKKTKPVKTFSMKDLILTSDLAQVIGGGTVRGYDPAGRKEIVG
jgi:hypothetical protein